jgi:hypothetical protein
MTIYYPDIASFQAGIDLRGAVAVSVKATEGTSYVNPDYSRAKANAANHGCFFTAYHFLLNGSAGAQAAHAHAHAGDSPLMVDVEAEGGSRPGVDDAAAFIDAYRQAGGVTRLVYLPHWYWQAIGSPSLRPLEIRGMALVSSAYTLYSDRDSGTGWGAYGGMTPRVWQYTDRLHFGGRDVDFNAFRGTHPGDQSGAAVADTLAQFKALCRTGKMTPHVPAAAPPATPQVHHASGKESLRHAVHRDGTSIPRALWLMAAEHKDGNFGHPLQANYVRGGDWDAIMPAGMPYVVG